MAPGGISWDDAQLVGLLDLFSMHSSESSNLANSTGTEEILGKASAKVDLEKQYFTYQLCGNKLP